MFSQLYFQLYYTPGHLNTFVGIDYEEKVDPNKHDGIKVRKYKIYNTDTYKYVNAKYI